MNILLIHLSKNWHGRVYTEYPMGLGIIGTLAARAGHRVTIHDTAVDDTPLAEVVDRIRPEVTGLSFLSTSSNFAAARIKALRDLPVGHLIAGGIHPTLFPHQVLDMGVDLVVRGEGELVIQEVLERLACQTPGRGLDERALGHLPGLVYRAGDGRVVATTDETRSVDLNTQPLLDRDLYDLSRYPHHSLITSRGCVYRCRFCCSWGPGGRPGRVTSPERVLEEMNTLYERYDADLVYWADDLFFFDRDTRLAFCELMRRSGPPSRWVAQLRVTDLDVELLTAMREAGCVKICVGAESGSDAILRTIGKGLRARAIEEGLGHASAVGLATKTWWMVGLPGGDSADQLAALDLIERARPNEVAVHTFVPLPGSHFWDHAETYGIRRPHMNELDQLYYYGKPANLYAYLSDPELTTVLKTYDERLRQLGYLSTDEATQDDAYVFTTPAQQAGFTV